MEVAIACIKDELGYKLSGFLKREAPLSLIVCTAGFNLGIPHVTKAQIGIVILLYLEKRLQDAPDSLHREASIRFS